MEIGGGLVGEIVIGATLGFSAGMISTCLINHYTNKETSIKDVLVGGVRGTASAAFSAAGGIKSVARALLN